MASASNPDHGPFDPRLIARHHREGPRYTSYPTADRFVEAFSAERYGEEVAKRRCETPARPWSLYVHLPFCATVCYYCGCNKIATRDTRRASAYVDYLLREVAMHAGQLEDDRRLAQVHWGGGSPTFLPFEQMQRLMLALRSYSTRADCDLIALGVSGIGAVGASYYQNQRQLGDYCNAIDRGVLPIMRGVELTADDFLRRAVIHGLMCHFALSMDAVETTHRIDFESYFLQELKALEQFVRDGLVELRDRRIIVTALGRFLVRNICMVFDCYLRERERRARYSKVI